MARDRRRVKGRSESGTFAAIPHVVLDSPEYLGLSFSARALLVELTRRYNGSNNGDLSAPYSQLKERGFGSKGTISKALKELVAADIIRIARPWQFTRKNGHCTLYALTWRAIDECGGKHDLAPTVVAPRSFKRPPATKIRNEK